VSQVAENKKVKSLDFRNHSRNWRDFTYVYPVISRRSRGLSIGINLNPDKACNFSCIYCQVDRTTKPRVRRVDLEVLGSELDVLVASAVSGSLFEESEFANTPDSLRRLNDLAFSGDGEPTACPVFAEAVALAVESKRRHAAHEAKIVLITDACYLMQPRVICGLELMDVSDGEIWAKLDAGTESYHRLINRPSHTLEHVIDNIVHAARIRPVTIQTLFMRVDDEAPHSGEISSYVDRLRQIRRQGGQIAAVQIYTVARPPAERSVSALSDEQLDQIVDTVRRATSLPVEPFYG